ncbi:MAG: GumC family protein [Candidatus Binatia bacterium]
MSRDIVPAGEFYPVRPVAESSTHETVEQLLYVLFKRWRLILGCFLSLVCAAAVVVFSRPTVHSAVAKILLKPDRVSLQISELSPDSARTPYSPQALQSELELIRSRDVLRPVALKLLAEEAPVGQATLDETIEAKLQSLKRALSLSTVKDTSIIVIAFRASSAVKAERLLGLVVTQYLEHHSLAYSGAAKLLEFFDAEKSRVGAELKAAEDELQRWQVANDVIAVDAQITGLLQQHGDLERRRKEIEAMTEVTLQSDPLIGRLKGELMTAEIALNDLRQRYTDQDRHVREKLAQVAMIQGQKAAAERALGASLGAQRTSLAHQVEKTGEALARLRGQRIEGDRLARAVEFAKNSFALYSKKRDGARISSDLDRAQLANVAIIEQPHGSETTDLDERLGLVILAGIVGITLGLVSAFVLEFFNKALRTRRDVEVYLGLPVLAAIPDLRVKALPDLTTPVAA